MLARAATLVLELGRCNDKIRPFCALQRRALVPQTRGPLYTFEVMSDHRKETAMPNYDVIVYHG